MAAQTTAGNVRAGGAYVELSTTDTKLQQGLKAAQNRLKKFSADIGALGAGLTKVGAGIVAPFALATKQYANFSDKMLVVRARTKATDQEFDAMKKRVSELTKVTSFADVEIAEGMINLASMGMNPTQINGMIEALLNLSRATGEELGNAVTIALNNMNIFKASIEETDRYTDILSKTANGSAQILGDLGEALKMSANNAKTANVDFLSLNAILAILANNGQRGTLAGTGLRNIFLSFTKNADKFEEYGLKIQDANKELRSMPDIFDDIAKKISNMPTMEKQQMFSDLFGTRGMNAAITLTGNVGALRDFIGELQKSSGDARQTSKLMDSEIGGALRGVGNSFKGLANEVGSAISSYIIPKLEQIRNILNVSTDWIKRNNAIIVSVAKVGAAAIALGVGLLALSKIVSVASMAIGAISFVCQKAVVALGLLFNPITAQIALFGALVGAAGFAAVALADMATSTSNEIQDSVWKTVDTFKNGFSAAFDDVKSGYENLKFAILNGKLEDAFAIIILSIKSIWHDLFDEIIGYWKQIESFFAKGFAWIYLKFDSSLNFDDMSKSIDDMINNDVESFKTARQKYQTEIANIINDIKENKPQNETQAESGGGKLGINSDLLDKLAKLPTPKAVEMQAENVVNNPTFGAFSLDAINYGAPTFEINKKMLNKLDKIEKNTRNDDDDDSVTVW